MEEEGEIPVHQVSQDGNPKQAKRQKVGEKTGQKPGTRIEVRLSGGWPKAGTANDTGFMFDDGKDKRADLELFRDFKFDKSKPLGFLNTGYLTGVEATRALALDLPSSSASVTRSTIVFVKGTKYNLWCWMPDHSKSLSSMLCGELKTNESCLDVSLGTPSADCSHPRCLLDWQAAFAGNATKPRIILAWDHSEKSFVSVDQIRIIVVRPLPVATFTMLTSVDQFCGTFVTRMNKEWATSMIRLEKGAKGGLIDTPVLISEIAKELPDDWNEPGVVILTDRDGSGQPDHFAPNKVCVQRFNRDIRAYGSAKTDAEFSVSVSAMLGITDALTSTTPVTADRALNLLLPNGLGSRRYAIRNNTRLSAEDIARLCSTR